MPKRTTSPVRLTPARPAGQSVWETVQHLAPLRFGYGVRSIEARALLEHLRQRQMIDRLLEAYRLL